MLVSTRETFVSSQTDPAAYACINKYRKSSDKDVVVTYSNL